MTARLEHLIKPGSAFAVTWLGSDRARAYCGARLGPADALSEDELVDAVLCRACARAAGWGDEDRRQRNPDGSRVRR
jgi:hypothetical protein